MKKLVYLVIVFLIAGCATGARFNGAEPTAKNKSAVYFFRPKAYVGAAVGFWVMDNGKKAIAIRNGQFVRYETKPGKHKFATKTAMIDKELEISLEPGETYYVRVDVDTGMWTSTIQLSKADPDQAANEIRSCCKSGTKEISRPAPTPKKKGKKNTPSGFADCEKQAEQGNVSAQHVLGRLYKNGEGVTQYYKEAVKWYRQAAEQGDVVAENIIETIYESGKGVTQDYKEALKWYRQAAEQGTVTAQYNLGLMHKNGNGVIQDDKEMVKWYTQAAEQGNAEAQHNLGMKYALGEGVVEDVIVAHMFFNIASANGHSKSPATRDLVAGQMTKEQIEKAQEMARVWVEKH